MLPQEVYETIHFNLTIENINDNAPIFESASVAVNIPESLKIGDSVEIPELVAFDPDGTEPKDLKYSIRGDDIFGIANIDGRVFLTPKIELDREVTAFQTGK